MSNTKETVLITGASAGLGRALALAYAARGSNVAMVARRSEPLETLAREIRGRGGACVALPHDVADKSAIHRITGEVGAIYGPVTTLINNASTLGPWQRLPLLVDTDCEALAEVLETNVVGPFRLTKAVIGHMLLRGEGLVVNITSDAAVAAYPRWGAYGVSKAALDQLSRIWAAEVDGTGVRVAAIDPGEMDTAMHRAAMPDADPATLAQPSAVAERLLHQLPRLQNGARWIVGPQ